MKSFLFPVLLVEQLLLCLAEISSLLLDLCIILSSVIIMHFIIIYIRFTNAVYMDYYTFGMNVSETKSETIVNSRRV